MLKAWRSITLWKRVLIGLVIGLAIGLALRYGLGSAIDVVSLDVNDDGQISLAELNDDLEAENPEEFAALKSLVSDCLLYTSPSPRDQRGSRMPSSA